MKSLPFPTLRTLIASTVVWFTAAGGSMAQLPDSTAFNIASNLATGTVSVNITEPGNHVWVLQASSNLSQWSDVQTFKIHNGAFRFRYTTAGFPTGTFFRTTYRPDGQSLTSTTAGALGSLVSTLNYAAPTLPAGFLVNPILREDNTPANNRVTDAGAKLGRALFYDKRLSFNQTVSCSSCHQQAHGFSDPAQFSTGFAGGHTGRNSMGLANARWYQRRAFFWDERSATLEDQVLQPIQNAVEMGMTLPLLVTRVQAEPYYVDLFQQAFATSTVTSDLISRALAQFVRSIISTQTKYDKVIAGQATFTAQEETGRQIFQTPALGNCAACHGTDNFVPTNTINNNGLESPYVDKGVGALTGDVDDEGLFKVPSLRNIELTGPYMHDGRFATLEQVVEFYNSGVVAHRNLSPPLRNPPGQGAPGSPRRLNLSVAQKAALVAFMKTLTDTTLTTDSKFADPFYYGD